MGKLGTVGLQTASGVVEVPVFELSDVEFDALRVQTHDGVGAVNLVDPADAEVDELRIQTANGPKAVSTSIEQWIDRFEDGDLSEYSVERDSATHVGVSSARSYEGTNSLRFVFDADEASGNVLSTSGLESYPSPGDTFEARFYPGAFHDRSLKILFGAQDRDNHYQLEARQWYSSSTRNLRLKRRENASGTLLAETSLSVGDSTQWLRFEVDWGTDGSITGRLENSSGSTLATVNATDYTFTSGGFGFSVYNGVGGSSGSPAYFDAARIR